MYQIYIVEYIVLFWLSDILVSASYRIIVIHSGYGGSFPTDANKF